MTELASSDTEQYKLSLFMSGFGWDRYIEFEPPVPCELLDSEELHPNNVSFSFVFSDDSHTAYQRLGWGSYAFTGRLRDCAYDGEGLVIHADHIAKHIGGEIVNESIERPSPPYYPGHFYPYVPRRRDDFPDDDEGRLRLMARRQADCEQVEQVIVET